MGERAAVNATQARRHEGATSVAEAANLNPQHPPSSIPTSAGLRDEDFLLEDARADRSDRELDVTADMDLNVTAVEEALRRVSSDLNVQAPAYLHGDDINVLAGCRTCTCRRHRRRGQP